MKPDISCHKAGYFMPHVISSCIWFLKTATELENIICCKILKALLLFSFHTLANSEDPDEMQPYAAFHQGLQFLLKLNNL